MDFRAAKLAPAVMLIASGCSGSGSGGNGGGDGPGQVSVTVQADGAPSGGTDVVFHHANGEVLQHVVTDQTGHAIHLAVPPDGLVTALYQAPSGARALRTVGGLDAGDEILFVFGDPPDDPDVATLDVTAAGPVPGATNYSIVTACSAIGSSTTSMTITVQQSCLDAGERVDLLLMADDDDDTLLAYSFAQNVDVDVVFDLDAPAWKTDMMQETVTVGNLTHPNAVAAFASGALIDGELGIEIFETGVEATGGTAVVPFASIPSFGQVAVLVSAAVFDDAGQESGSFRIEAFPPPLPSVTYDAAVDYLPPLLGITTDTSGGPARPTIHWEEISLAEIDLFEAGLIWENADIAWELNVPVSNVDGASFVVPELPSALTALFPTDEEPQAFVLILDSSEADDFDDLKHHASSTLDLESTTSTIGAVLRVAQSGSF